MVQNIRRVGRQFRPMRQEDAHEYLRQLLDCMHEEVLKANNVKTSDGKISETKLISRTFGGYLCNELKCSLCTYSSKHTNLLIYHQILLKKDLENDCTFLMSKYRVNISVRYTNNHQKFD